MILKKLLKHDVTIEEFSIYKGERYSSEIQIITALYIIQLNKYLTKQLSIFCIFNQLKSFYKHKWDCKLNYQI